MRITVQRLLDLQCEAIHTAAHICCTRGEPHTHSGGRNNHPRSAVITRRKVSRLD